MAEMVPVTFVPGGLTAWVHVGATVLEAATTAGILLPAPCGGRGLCGACGVRIVEGVLGTPDNGERIGLASAPDGIRLACRASVIAPVRVSVLVHHGSAPEISDFITTAFGSLCAGVDLGTTSVAAVLIEAETGRELARASVANRQQSLGADVLTRVSASLSGQREELMALAEASVLDALSTAARASGVGLERIERIVLAGNSAMTAMLIGRDVSSLSRHPFTPPFGGGPMSHDSAVMRALAADASTVVLPPVAGFVGGDALAAVIGAGMVSATAPILFVDFGTNVEIVLADRGRLMVASAAAGPAFEGAGISCGGPAVDGAVVRVRSRQDGSVSVDVLGGGRPMWFSGSGLVSAVALLRRLGHISTDGRLTSAGPLRDRFSTDASGVVTVSLGTEGGRPSLSQLDVRTFQLAKAAVKVGVEAVLGAAGVEPTRLADVLLAGAFGSALEVCDLIELGLLPRSVSDVSRSVGNAALNGAAAISLDAALLSLAEDTAQGAHHVDLAGDPEFNSRFLKAMALEPFGSGRGVSASR